MEGPPATDDGDLEIRLDARPTKRTKRSNPDWAAKFRRGEAVATKKIEDKKLKGKLRYTEAVVRDAQASAAQVEEWLLPAEPGSLEAEGLERTWRFQQQDIVQAVDTGAARKVFDLALTELGPYSIDHTRSGRHMLLGGRKGHLALLDRQRLQTVCEVQVRETVRDVQFLHNETFFAAAQKQYVYIYDKRGLEVHCLKDHTEASCLDFLPYHFLLTSIGRPGVLRYQDTSTGQIVAQHRTRQGPCDVLSHNPWNGVALTGHANGSISMWTPTITTPVVRMLCHHGPVRSLAVDPTGRYLVTTGADSQVKVWDVRTYRPLHAYKSAAPAERCDISQRGMLAVGYGRRVQVWRDALATKAAAPYLNHSVAGGVLEDLSFVPYEDVLCLGHSGGVSTMLVPGAGEPNYDSYVADPFQTKKQRHEAEVHSLLDKLQPEMITLDPGTIGRVEREPKEVQRERQREAAEANAARKAAGRAKSDDKTKMKGKNKPTRRRKKHQDNIIEERKPKIKAAMREQGVSAEHGRKADKGETERALLSEVPRALHKLYKKN